MSLNCPNCKTDLPENGDLEYRFCPRCGAEITAHAAEIADDYQTIPPDVNHTARQRRERAPEPENVETPPAAIPNQTLEPVIAGKRKPRPVVVPPPGPPPSSFYRTDSPHLKSGPENAQEAQIHGSRRPLKVLIIMGAIAILMGAILYLLLV